MMDDETREILGMRVYDVMNILGLQMEEKNSKTEEIIIQAYNNHTKKHNTLTVTLEEE